MKNRIYCFRRRGWKELVGRIYGRKIELEFLEFRLVW